MYGYEVFHEDIAKKLISLSRKKHTGHAYIFEGDKGVGKLKAARLFAASLVCENTDRSPCGECSACIGAKAYTNPDIKYIASDKSIGVDIMRDIVSDAYIKPFLSRHKVYIIENGNLMTEQAQNAFLKILEEPPEYAVFIILSSNPEMLLQTVISRCIPIRFTSVSKETVKEYAAKKYPQENPDFLAEYAGGNIGIIDEIMEREDFFPLREAALTLVLPLCSEKKLSAYKIAEFMEENKDNALEIISFWKSMLRDILLIHNSADTLVINKDKLSKLKQLAVRITPEICMKAEEALDTAEEMLGRYINPNVRAVRAIALYLSFTIKKGYAI